MGISNRLLGKKNVNGKPHIESVSPGSALPGGEIRINGSSLRPAELKRPRVQFGDVEGAVVISSDDFVVARVPDGGYFRSGGGCHQRSRQQRPAGESRGSDRGQPAPRDQPSDRHRRQHLRHVFGIARTAGPGLYCSRSIPITR